MSSNSRIRIMEQFQKRVKHIEEFVPKFTLAGTPADFKDISIIYRVAAFVYSEIYADLVSQFDEDDAIMHLRNLGSRVADRLYKMFVVPSKKYLKVKNLFPEVAKQFFNVKLKVMDIKKKKGIVQSAKLRVYNCILCKGLPPIIGSKIHYCLPTEAFYENFFNLMAAAHSKMKERNIQIRIIQSMGSGAKTCDYQLTTIEQAPY